MTRIRKNDNFWLWIILALFFFGTGIGRFFLGAAAVLALALTLLIFRKLFRRESSEKERTESGEEKEKAPNAVPFRESACGEEALPGMDPADAEIFRGARRTERNIRLKAGCIRDRDVQTAAEAYCRVTDRILRALKSQPDELRTVQLYLQYSLPAAAEMLRKYGQMEDSNAAGAEVKGKILSFLREASEEGELQLQEIFADDVAGIDAELELLRQSRGQREI